MQSRGPILVVHTAGQGRVLWDACGFCSSPACQAGADECPWAAGVWKRVISVPSGGPQGAPGGPLMGSENGVVFHCFHRELFPSLTNRPVFFAWINHMLETVVQTMTSQ